MLLGRRSDEARLRVALAGPAACAVVHGEPGVGKSTLVRHVLGDRAHVEGGALATLGWSAYLPLRRAFAAGELPERTWSGDPRFVAMAIEEVLGHRVLFVDDLHWADSETVTVLSMLAGRVPMVLGLRRGAPATAGLLARFAGVAERIDLEPLETRDAEALAARCAPGLGPEEWASLAARTGGNPLLIEEFARADGNVASLELAMLARCRELPRAELDDLALLAVAGHPLPEAAVAAHDPLTARGLLTRSDGVVGIRHALLEHAVLQLVSRERRLRCHRQLAGLLDDPGQRSRHLLAAGRRPAAHAAALEAVTRARTPGERWRHLITAAESAVGGERRRLGILAIRAASEAGEPREAAGIVEHLGDDEGDAAVHLARATSAFASWDLEAHLDHSRRALDVAEPGGLEEVEALLNVAQGLLQVTGDPAAGRDLALLALAKAEAGGLPVGRPAKVAADCTVAPGDPGWLAAYERVLAAAVDADDVPLEIATNLEIIQRHFLDLDFGAARETATRMTDRCGALQLSVWQAAFEGWLLRLATCSGDHDHVLEHGPRLLARPRSPYDMGTDEAALALTYAQVGRFAEALELLAPEPRQRASIVHPGAEVMHRVAQIQVHWLAGEPERALEQAAPLLAAGPLDPYLLAWAVPGLEWSAWDADLAPPELPELAMLPFARGVVREMEGLAALREGRHEEAVALFEEAAELHTPNLKRGQVHCVWAAAEARRLAGDPSAETAMLAAEQVARESRLAATMVRCQRSLRALGVRRGGPPRPGGSPLTSREHEVVMLAVEGLTDQQVAARLGVARRTVQTHLANARRKLGATSRTQLVAMVAGEQL